MKSHRVWIRTATCVAALLATTAVAHAQATRTWVSGVGDDANPCSRTAPCKTFAGAISKTAAGGEINVLDPGGFGAVTITKSISIEAEDIAGVLVSGTNGIVISAGASDTVVLRGLTIEGLGTGLAGVKFLSGGTLQIQDCTVNNFTQKGIDIEPTSGAVTVSIKNTITRNNNGASSGGIFIHPTGTATVNATLENVTMDHNNNGLVAQNGAGANAVKVMVRNSIASNNANNGFTLSGGNALMDLDECIASGNVLGSGLRADALGSVMRISNVTATQNIQSVNATNSAQVLSYSNNRLTGNGTDVGPTGTVGQQ